MAIQTVGVVGCGQMGSGVAQVAAQHGFTVMVYDIEQDYIDRGIEHIRTLLEKDVNRNKISADDRTATLSRLRSTTKLNDMAGCEVIIEAIVEEAAIKRKVFTDLDGLCSPETIFTSNTSSIPIIELATATSRPDRFAGLHFFNPVPVMQLIELIRAITTSDATSAALKQFGAALGKTVVEAQDRAGFIVNRLLVPYLLDAMRVYEAGLASRDDIDQGMQLGCNHPMGPLALSDFIGLDTLLSIANMLYAEFHEPRFAPPPLLKRMVQAQRLGKKAGQGFYAYPA